MKTKLFFVATIAFLLFQSGFKAQVANYTFTQSLVTYSAISSGTIVGPTFQDDDVTNVTLPFQFVYDGTTYTNVNVCSNGYLSFNNLNGFEYTAISDIGTQNVICPFGQDLIMAVLITADLTQGSNTLTNCSSVTGYSVGDVLWDYGFDFGNVNPTITAISGNNIVVNTNAASTTTGYDVANYHGNIKSLVSGTSPNRVFELQYSNFSRIGIYDEMINFKVKLYETSNKIEFVYGNMVPGNDNTPSEVGLKGNTNSDFNSRKVIAPTNWSNSVASSSITDVCDFLTSLFPLNGQSYLWAPISCTTPVLSIAQSNTVLCAGEQATLTANGAATYSWVNATTNAVLVITPTITTTYTLIGSNSNCTNSISITQSVTPNPSVSVLQSSTLICSGSSATLTASGAGTYSWNTGENAAQIIVTPTTTSTYSVKGSNGNCIGETNVVVNVNQCTGIENLADIEPRFTLYPNPFSGLVYLSNQESTARQVVIQNALGKVVYQSVAGANETLSLNLDNIASGMYYVTLKNDRFSETKKLVKQ